MWPFHRGAPLPDTPLVDALHELAGVVKRLREDHEALSAAHERLRGRFYALKSVPRDEEKPDSPSKAEALRDFFKPGQPTQHPR